MPDGERVLERHHHAWRFPRSSRRKRGSYHEETTMRPGPLITALVLLTPCSLIAQGQAAFLQPGTRVR